ncbi:MAG: hypothetical protein PHQ52_08200 [Candidatus Omnitrophica bacterium]|nr:hypothetical protein [Candidatus Omnitrophota bacterium]
MKNYIKPKIKVVVLDPEQAVLEVCKIAGVFFYETHGHYLCLRYLSGGPARCSVSAKGGPTPMLVDCSLDEEESTQS